MTVVDAASALADLRSAVAHLHPDDPAELVAVADDLCVLGSPTAAIPFYEAAMELAVPGAVYRLGVVHHGLGDHEAAFRCFELAGLAGDEYGAFMAAQLAHEHGDLHAARRWYENAQGVEGAPDRLAGVLQDLDGPEPEPERYEPAPYAEPEPEPYEPVLFAEPEPYEEPEGWEAAVAQARSGALAHDDAIGLLESWAGTGEARVAPALADLYVLAGRALDAEDLLEQAALAGDAASTTSLGLLRLRAGRVPEAMAAWRSASAQGDGAASELLERFG